MQKKRHFYTFRKSILLRNIVEQVHILYDDDEAGLQPMELNVMQKTRDLCDYVLTVTHKSPKEFRFTIVSKLHGYVLSAMENLLRANELRMDGAEHITRRKEYQLEAMIDLRLLGYFANIARTQKCILPKQYEQITQKIFECRNLLLAWIKSDAKCVSKKDERLTNNDYDYNAFKQELEGIIEEKAQSKGNYIYG